MYVQLATAATARTTIRVPDVRRVILWKPSLTASARCSIIGYQLPRDYRGGGGGQLRVMDFQKNHILLCEADFILFTVV